MASIAADVNFRYSFMDTPAGILLAAFPDRFQLMQSKSLLDNVLRLALLEGVV